MTAAYLGSVDYGTPPTITATTINSSGVLTSPTAVTFIVRDPTGTETSTSSPNAQITNPSTGVWQYTFPAIVTVGTYYVRFKGTATLIVAEECYFDVEASSFSSP